MKKKVTKATEASIDASSIPFIDINTIRPYKSNPRVHSDDQIARLVGSIQEFGWTRPIICDETLTILAGHGCYEAAKAMGLDRVPVIIKSGLTKNQKKAYILADNKLAEHSRWDENLLRIELKSLDVNLVELTGFMPYELKDIYLETGEGANIPHNIGQDVSMVKCPECGHEFPK